MDVHRLIVVLVTVLALGLSACGGGGGTTTGTGTTSGAGASTGTGTTTRAASASGSERSKLLAQLRANVESPGSTVSGETDLDSCIVEQAGKLPLAQLRAVASSQAGGSVTNPLVARCVALGRGLAFVRAAIADVVAGKLPAPVPANFTRCVVNGVHALSAQQLARAVNGASATDQAYARHLGEELAIDCIGQPAIFVQWRQLWLGNVRRSLQGHNLSAAFKRCALAKAARISPAELKKLVTAGSAAETAYGRRLGRECRATS